jgi:hypothetical protein
MIDTGMGPVFAFCEAAIKWTFIYLSIEAKCLDGSTPLHCCVVRTINRKRDITDTSTPTRYFQWGLRG